MDPIGTALLCAIGVYPNGMVGTIPSHLSTANR